MVVQSKSDRKPFDRPELARPALRLIATADAMGLLPPSHPSALDARQVRSVLDSIQRAGIGVAGEAAFAAGGAAVTVESAAWLDRVRAALEECPVPKSEWKRLLGLFDADQLAALLGIAPASVRRYAFGARRTPDEVAARLHFLALVTGNLLGAYNEIGVRRWFERKRELLGGRTPRELLGGAWSPDDAGPRRVRELARSLLGSPAT